MRALLFGALIGLLLAFPQLLAAALTVTTYLTARPLLAASLLGVLAVLRPRTIRGWSR